MESQVRALIAHRMKGKGRYWSAKGLRHLAKVRQVVHNDRLSTWCGRHRGFLGAPSKTLPTKVKPRPRLRDDPGAWLQAHLPFLEGPIPTEFALLRLRPRLRLHGLPGMNG